MKKTGILNQPISAAIAGLGHMARGSCCGVAGLAVKTVATPLLQRAEASTGVWSTLPLPQEISNWSCELRDNSL